MAKSANVVVCRNIRPVKAGEESYEDIEKAFWMAIKPAKLERHLTISIAAHMRRENRQLKMRVSILKGDIWPVISIKVRGQPTYVKI